MSSGTRIRTSLTDIEAANGVVQVIDRVLLPIDVPGGEDTGAMADLAAVDSIDLADMEMVEPAMPDHAPMADDAYM